MPAAHVDQRTFGPLDPMPPGGGSSSGLRREGISHSSRMTREPLDQGDIRQVTSAHAAIARSAAALILTASVLTACGSEGGPPVLNWYINPDNGGQSRLAEKCAKASNGAYKVDTQTLPNDASQQREQLVRRLAAKDSSIDV